ncbi:hypothetical protein BOTNAR_0153g00080 [Botryotinia narcissicola]|uniref:DUF7918 domain-containing protein n=1 Tax=Botryotinia narcissicola TaxID=278944 RepID=A0A4Z1IHF2_9HELO|nr:hypothetical protein BOTNAR_0153g00080 [Botryotinia narcissicola]
MAVLEGLRGIEVTVCVDKQALQEYDDDEPEGVPAEVEGFDKATKMVSRYIESTTGKVFCIKIDITKAYKVDSPSLSFHFFVDGISVHSRCCGKKLITLLGAAQPIRAIRHSLSDFIDGKDCPIAIYRFKYRSKECLKSLLILERTPESSPSPSPAPISNGASGSFALESLDATQKAKLQEFLGNLLGNGGQSNGERKIKREREENSMDSKTNKRSKRNERVEVDLTGDDSD